MSCVVDKEGNRKFKCVSQKTSWAKDLSQLKDCLYTLEYISGSLYSVETFQI